MVKMLLTAAIAHHAFRMVRRDKIALHRSAIVGHQIELRHANLLKHGIELFRSALMPIISRPIR